jgi:hypothetical protein
MYVCMYVCTDNTHAHTLPFGLAVSMKTQIQSVQLQPRAEMLYLGPEELHQIWDAPAQKRPACMFVCMYLCMYPAESWDVIFGPRRTASDLRCSRTKKACMLYVCVYVCVYVCIQHVQMLYLGPEAALRFEMLQNKTCLRVCVCVYVHTYVLMHWCLDPKVQRQIWVLLWQKIHVCVRVYVWMYVCMYQCMNVCVYVCIQHIQMWYSDTKAPRQTWCAPEQKRHACMHACVSECVCVFICMYFYVCMCQVYLYRHVCMCQVCMYVSSMYVCVKCILV